ncbi:PREDICTED: uncharacterized protein LOC104703784 [Camelina sativa]|uniref:Uncharacterized protein LOC104703784 n=1 Tax=Camelina sativa TaxID=90675 RepID=A0ABM1Q7V1_CAMSA|nr:PREDICTED: uncharacterized protein LOC104703784 [Camelina sativa]
MEPIGGFHEAELSQLVYHHTKYQPIPKTQSQTSSDKHKPQPFQPFFYCPSTRIIYDYSHFIYPVRYSPEYVESTTSSDDSDDAYEEHSILPLFWCNNKEFNVNGGCYICSGSNFGTDYYFCDICDQTYHKECVQSPFKIKHPHHPKHSLQLSYLRPNAPDIECLCCGKRAMGLVYNCTRCDVAMHTVCAMKSIPFGGFHEVETDGKQYLVYHHPKYQPIPQAQTPVSSFGELVNDALFVCPVSRCLKDGNQNSHPLTSSPEYIVSKIRTSRNRTRSAHQKIHSVLPLFWCNNKEFDDDGECGICSGAKFGTDYYFCVECDTILHRECVKAPLKIKHPYHPKHSLQLYYYRPTQDAECLCCGRGASDMVYYCTKCDVVMHTTCAMTSIPFVVDQPKTHDHPLTLFPKQASLTCNVCGLIREGKPTYVCLKCSFVAHNDCMYSPRIIKISRHNHRISYTASLQSQECYCGVCRKSIDGDYGSYTCDKCDDDFAVHVRCALRRDVCDGVELEGVPEEDDITQDDEPFEMISKGVILHFLHDHYLRLEVSLIYDENKLCQACVMPIIKEEFYSFMECEFYSCMECEFMLHKTCANSPRRIQHLLHPHPLKLIPESEYGNRVYYCDACYRYCGGFMYFCPIVECDFCVDVRCAAISEPFVFQGHDDPLFLALDPEVKPICKVCKSECRKQFNCIKCDFIVCINCATLPYKARYKHDKHLLTLLWGTEVCEKDWCEVCERNLQDTSTKLFYWCNDCCTTLHIACLFNDDLYVKPGQILKVKGKEVKVIAKRNLSRPLCDSCKYPCQGRVLTTDNNKACSMKCVRDIVTEDENPVS